MSNTISQFTEMQSIKSHNMYHIIKTCVYILFKCISHSKMQKRFTCMCKLDQNSKIITMKYSRQNSIKVNICQSRNMIHTHRFRYTMDILLDQVRKMSFFLKQKDQWPSTTCKDIFQVHVKCEDLIGGQNIKNNFSHFHQFFLG